MMRSDDIYYQESIAVLSASTVSTMRRDQRSCATQTVHVTQKHLKHSAPNPFHYIVAI